MNKFDGHAILDRARTLLSQGTVVQYIPELKKVDPSLLGYCIVDVDGNTLSFGDAQIKFTIQSISKVITFTCCLMDRSLEEIKERVTFEPTSSAFNAISDLENKNAHRPLNPYLNAGAFSVLSLMKKESFEQCFEQVLDLLRLMTGNSSLTYNRSAYLSAYQTAYRNRSLLYYMQSTGILDKDTDIEALLDAYCKICCIEMTAQELAALSLVYAQKGYSSLSGKQCFDPKIASIVNATVMLCGMYDESGETAVSVGLPCKSGVGGGLMAVAPGRMGIGIFGPALNAKSNSIGGMSILEQLSEELDLTIF